MTLTIPPEIWLRTAQFTPSSILRNLYSVNAVFLDLALNDRYSDITLEMCGSAMLKRLNHPHIAHRVRRFSLDSHWFTRLMEAESKKVTLRTMVAWFDMKKDKALTETAVVKFLNISSLTISSFGCSSQLEPDPILMNAYTACASNLRELELISFSGGFHTILPLNASMLTSLEKVTFIINDDELRTDLSAEAEAIRTFFKAIASTLATLNISFNDTPDETSQLLKCFPRKGAGAPFPKLTSFSIRHCHCRLPPLPDSTLMEFLNQHADTLKRLSLQHIPLSPQLLEFSDHLSLPVLPHLETLELENALTFSDVRDVTSSEGLDTVLAFFQHSGSTLTNLSLAHCSFTLHDLGMLLDVLGRWASLEGGGGLKNLTVTVQVMTPQLLDMLVEKLPKLDLLKIRSRDLRSNDVPDVSTSGGSRARPELTDENIESFLLEMKTRSYSGWSLRCLGIEIFRLNTLKIMIPLTRMCFPHLVEMDCGHGMQMWREPGSIWKPSNLEEFSLFIDPTVDYSLL